jgi:hypothetical protein
MTDPNMHHDINQIEEQLKSTLRRQDAPADFSEQVLVRLAAHNSVPPLRRDPWWRIFTQPLLRWTAITATATSLAIGGIHYRNLRRERAQGEAAKQQLMLALRIAGSKLQLAKAKVNEINATQTANRSRSQEE